MQPNSSGNSGVLSVVVSELERVGVPRRTYLGLTMIEIARARGIVKATMATSSTEKLVLKGTLTFDRHGSDSWKFPNGEVIISLFGKEQPHLETRAKNDGWFRMELCLPVEVGAEDK